MTSVLNSDCECLVIENAIIIIVKNQNQQLTEEKNWKALQQWQKLCRLV